MSKMARFLITPGKCEIYFNLTGRCRQNESVLIYVKVDHYTAKREWQIISVGNPYLVIDFGKLSFV